MRISAVMSREPSYTRNKVILRGMKEVGLEVFEFSDYSRLYPTRFFKVISRFARTPVESDAVLVGFFGQPLMPFVRALTDQPIILDIFITGFDTMCFDRKRFTPRSVPGRFFHWLDREACRKADLILLDTYEHIDYFVEAFGVPREKFRRIFVGADTNVFFPRDNLPPRNDGFFRLFYYCTYHPVHGVEHVVKAANNLKREKDIRFTLIGSGQEKDRIDEMARRLAVTNVEFVPWIDYLDLPQAIADSDVCLGGHFSTIDKASRVIPGKVY